MNLLVYRYDWAVRPVHLSRESVSLTSSFYRLNSLADQRLNMRAKMRRGRKV